MEFMQYFDELKDKKVAVIGLGISNTPLIELLLNNNISVCICDMRTEEMLGDIVEKFRNMGAKLSLGPSYLDDMSFDVIFRTPGILPTDEKLIAAKNQGAIITSEMEAFFSLCKCKIIAVTGSDGKTTTSSIIAELLKAAGKTVHLGGNIGKPLLPEIPCFNPDDIAVVELSSFQLHSISISPDIAVVTNVSPNHLDKHIDFEDYLLSKKRIFEMQKPDSKLILNLDNSYTAKFQEEAVSGVLLFSMKEAVKNGCFCRDNMIYYSRDYEVEPIIPASEILLPGEHNIENYLAAFCAVEGMVSAQMCRAVARSYGGVAHRLELVKKINGVSYINDSIASSPTRTVAGLRAMRTKVLLIAGGHDKNIPIDYLADVICDHVKALFLTGDTAEKIAEAVKSSVFYDPGKLPILITEDLKDAVTAAKNMAVFGDTVLLSPACSSFDRFRNFAERGDLFRNIVLGFSEDE